MRLFFVLVMMPILTVFGFANAQLSDNETINNEIGNTRCVKDPEENQITMSTVAFNKVDPTWILFGMAAFDKISDPEDWVVINGFKRMFGLKYVLFYKLLFFDTSFN